MTSITLLLVLIVALGFISISFFVTEKGLTGKTLLVTALAGPAGFGIVSILVFISYFIDGVRAPRVSLILTLLLLIVLTGSYLKKYPPVLPRFSFPDLFNRIRRAGFAAQTESLMTFAAAVLFITLLLKCVDTFSVLTVQNPEGGWDARFFWSLKAKFYTRSPAEWKTMFSSLLAWAHPDYPLLLPGSIAWGWNFLGGENLLWPAWIALIFYLSLCLLLLWHIGHRHSFFWGFLAASVFLAVEPYLFWAIQQYADVPLAFFITASILVVTAALRHGSQKLLILGGFLAGLAAWTKNEGQLFAVWTAALIFLAGLPAGLRQKKFFFENLLAFLKGLAVPFICVLILKKFLGTTSDYLGEGKSISAFIQSVFFSPGQTGLILNGFYTYLTSWSLWKGLWILFGISVLVFTGKAVLMKRRDGAWITLAAVLLINLGYFLTLHVTPHEIRWQIQTALTRLLLHSAALGLVFCFDVLALAPQKIFESKKVPS